MFYQMVTKARNRWLASSECTVKDLIAYIECANQMRDAQIDAIKLPGTANRPHAKFDMP